VDDLEDDRFRDAMLGGRVNSQAWMELLLPGLPAMLRAASAAAIVPAFTGMPASIRAGLAVAAAVVAWPLGVQSVPPEGSIWMWAPQEVLAGGLVGATAAAAAAALRLAGRVIGEQMGLGLGEIAQPDGALDEGNAAESTLGWCAAACFVSVGGVEGVVLAAARPRAGSAAWGLGAEGIAQALDAATQLALRVSLPVVALTFAGMAIGGVLVRAAPGVVTLAGGFGVRAAMGLGMLSATAAGVWVAQSGLVRDVLARLGGGVA
jgi:flagellar biosynthesis protein FliR